MVMIDLDRPREIRFGFKALKQVKAITDKSVPEIMRELEEKATPFLEVEVIQQLMWCGLNDPELKYDDLELLLDKTDFSTITQKLMEAVRESFGVNTEPAPEGKKK